MIFVGWTLKQVEEVVARHGCTLTGVQANDSDTIWCRVETPFDDSKPALRNSRRYQYLCKIFHDLYALNRDGIVEFSFDHEIQIFRGCAAFVLRFKDAWDASDR